MKRTVLRRLAVTACSGLLALSLAAQVVDISRDEIPNQSRLVELDLDRLGEPLGEPLEGEALEEASRAIGGKMRCPVCQGMAISASPSPMAVAMSEQVRDLLGNGYTSEQVWSYFEGSYGEFVRLEPKPEGLNWLVWLVPPIALLGGALALVALQRSRAAAATPAAAAEEGLDDFLQQVRDATRR
ncbi:MAG: cytochrome c-type biogenesis protein [Acidobacteriota bacterium]